MVQAAPPTSGPLSHLTVIDLTQHLAGPFATQMLGDLGARVVKVEPPAGDPTRRVGPYFVQGTSAYYLSVNRNKLSVCLNLKAPGGTDAFLALAAHADVVIENFSPGTMDKLGIGREVLADVNPKLVHCSISGFGQDGPYRRKPAFDIIVQALSGGMSLTGEPEGESVRSGLPIGDLCAGMNAVTGILAALQQVTVTGEGSYVDVAMLDTQISLLSYVASYYLLGGYVAGRQGRGHVSIPSYGAFTAGDGAEIVIAANTEQMWQRLCAALDLEPLLTDERFTDNDQRREHREELQPILEAAIRRWPATEVLDRLAAADVPAAPINSIDAALADPQVRHRDMVTTIRTPGGEVLGTGNPVKIAGNHVRHELHPVLGEDTEEVLRSVGGLSEEMIAELARTHAILPRSGEQQ
jgi:CoA:oxalate CoA-transferase